MAAGVTTLEFGEKDSTGAPSGARNFAGNLQRQMRTAIARRERLLNDRHKRSVDIQRQECACGAITGNSLIIGARCRQE
jgi:hypothetical protein